MKEHEFIAAEQAKLDKKLLRQLTKIEKTGTIGNDASETLWINGLIQMGGPRPKISNPYNCWHLTRKGQETLETLPR